MRFSLPQSRRACIFGFALLSGMCVFGQESGQDMGTEQQTAAAVSPPAVQDNAPPNTAKTDNPAKTDATKPDEQQAPPDKRVFGVLPNYRTVNETGVYTPIPAKNKMLIATKDSFDYPLVLLAGAFAGLGQLTDQNPSFGQGMAGFGRRFGTAYADQAIGNMFTEGIFPSLLHEDPRYRRQGPSYGSPGKRTWYAISRIFVTYTDSGKQRFNYSEWVGNATGVAISNAYYPDGRNWGDNATKLLEQCGTDAISQVLKEFWPDIKRKFFHKNQSAAADSH